MPTYSRNFGDWQVYGSVDRAGDGPMVPVIHVRHRVRELRRSHALTGFHHATPAEASAFLDSQLDAVVGVSEDGSLQFR